MFNAIQTITLYNAVFDSATDSDVFKRTVIEGVSWFSRTLTTVANEGGLKAAGEYQIRIPQDTRYVAPESYTGAAGTWTLRPGDIIAKGERQAAQNPRPKDLLVGEACTIVGVTDNRGKLSPHFKVVGK